MRELNSRSRFSYTRQGDPLGPPSTTTRAYVSRFGIAVANSSQEPQIHSHGVRKDPAIFSLLPRAKNVPFVSLFVAESDLCRSGCGIFAAPCVNLFAANQLFRFIARMSCTARADSKLCADNPRHATREFCEFSVAQLGKGQGVALPVASPPCRRTRRMETLPVSIPSGSCAAFAFASSEVRP